MKSKKCRAGILYIYFHALSFGLLPLLVSGQDTRNISFKDQNTKLYGWFYRATGNGPFTTLILLQGARGNDGDLFGLGRALSDEGYNTLTYSYPGSWRSEGLKTNEAALSSVQAAIDFAKTSASTYAIDTTDIVLIGYSYGGGMALLGSVNDPAVKKVISIAGGDLSVVANRIENDPEYRKRHLQVIDWILSDSTVARGPRGEAYHTMLLKSRDQYDLKKHAAELAKKKILLIGGWYDDGIRIEDHILPLYRKLYSISPGNIEIHAFKTDHTFSNVQELLREIVVNWLKTNE